MGIGYRNQSIWLGGEYIVRLKVLATVVNHTATVYPTIDAVCDLDRNTEMKNAVEI